MPGRDHGRQTPDKVGLACLVMILISAKGGISHHEDTCLRCLCQSGEQ